MNHDALFKKLLKSPTILSGFFSAFLPAAARFVDFGVLELVDKERFTIDGKKRTGDLLVKTRFRGQVAAFLIHMEHQAQVDEDLAWRILEYCVLDHKDFHLPVYPIALLSHAKPCPKNLVPLHMDFPNRRVLAFEFDVIDLARLEAKSYVRIRNPAALALAARMKSGANERMSLTCNFFISLANTAIDPADKELVAGFFSVYQPLNQREALQLERELSKVTPGAVREKVMNLTNPFIELGKQRGRAEGISEGRQQEGAELVLRILTRRLGPLSSSHERAIRKLELRKIERLGEALLEFSSSTDLGRWLKQNGK